MTAELPLPPELTLRLRAVAAETPAPLEAVLLAAHLRVVAALTSRQEAVTGYVPADGDPAAPRALEVRGVLRSSWRELVMQAAEGIRRIARPETGAGAVAPVPATPAGPYPESVLDLSANDPASEPRDTPPLWVRFQVDEDGVTVWARSRTDVLSEKHLTRIVGYHGRALQLLAAHPDAPAGERSLLTEEERHRQIYGLVGPAAPFEGRLFVERFEEQVRSTPHAVALTHRDRSWTYARLNASANRIAHALLASDLHDEDVVAVLMDRGPEWAAATIGVLKAGGCYLPVQPDFPAARIAAQLDGAGCRFVLGRGQAARTAVSAGEGRRQLDAAALCAGGEDPGEYGGGNPGRAHAPGQLAYIYFTSGSTGTPKGVMCEHAGLLNHLMMKVADLGLRAGDVVAQTAAQSLDISLWQLVAPLLTGGSTYIVDTDVLLDVDRFAAKLAARGVAVVQFVPSYFDAFVTALERRPCDLGVLRAVVVTGEELKPALVRRWFACRPDIPLVNAYGATEVSDDTMHEILDRAPQDGLVPLGRMRHNVHGYVLDEQGGLAPLGSPGEIVFSGVPVGRGYVNDPARTQAAFLPDPFRPGQRMYRTGDFGRWLPGGRLQFLGRRDQQVRIRGHRVETGEVENRLLALDEVKDAVVVASQGTGDERILVAFLVGTGRLDAGGVRQALADHLPEFMLPTYCHWLDALPVNGNGKVDRKVLTELAGTLGHADVPSTAPVTATERLLAMAWAEALNAPLQCIGRSDNFFALGGTSLSAVWLVVKLNRLVSLAQIIAHPVLSDLASAVDAGADTASKCATSSLLRPLSGALPAAAPPEGRLVCFPAAGGNAVNYLPLARGLASCGIEVYGVELPGHDFVPGAQELADVAAVARLVASELARLPAVPLLLWGQREGTAHALALAAVLEEQGTVPRRVLVVGFGEDWPDGLSARMELAGAMSDQEVAASLLREGAYVEFDGLKSERAGLLGPAYRHDVRSTGDFLLHAQRDPEAHRVRVGIDLLVAADGPDAPAPERDDGRWSWHLLSPEVTRRRFSGAPALFPYVPVADARDAVLAALGRSPLRSREEVHAQRR
ncbi:amino acid adenylation domain-containing protein [Streptomyces sp. NPDC051132]|uniref:non-ribosomal peptide synthetase family protein n=1 Tax=unclassified Streptomyces TaxID=2593676 RepID=UPI00342785D8